MAVRNTQWRYHYAGADDASGIDFDKYERNGLELCGLASHNGKLVAVFKRNPTAKDDASRAARKSRSGKADFIRGESRGPRGR